MTKEELLQARAQFVKQYVENGNLKGIRTTFSVRSLSERILFVTERTIYDDLAKAKRQPTEENENDHGSKY